MPVTYLSDTEIGLGLNGMDRNSLPPAPSAILDGARVQLFLERVEITCPPADDGPGPLRLTRNRGLESFPVDPVATGSGTLVETVTGCRFGLVDAGATGSHLLRIQFTVQADRRQLPIGRQFRLP